MSSEKEIKVSELNRAITINSADYMMIIQDGINKKVSGDRFFEKMKSIIKPIVLWENLNPEAGMEENTNINLLDEEYDEIRWFYVFSNSGANLEMQQSISCQKQKSVLLFAIGYNTGHTVRRTLEYVSKTQYKALVGKKNDVDDVNCCIPVKAVGIKYLNINGNNDDVKIPNQILNEYLEAFNNNFVDKTVEFDNSVEAKINEAKEEINNVLGNNNDFARAVKGTVQDVSFAQIYADSPVIEGLEIKGNSKNILPIEIETWEIGTLTTSSGNPNSSSARIRTKNYIEVEPNANYYCNIINQGYCFTNIHYFTADKTWINNQDNISSINGSPNKEITTPENTAYIKVVVRRADGAEMTVGEIENINPSIIKRIDAISVNITGIEPYKNKKYTITLPENKFLDVNSCIKKVDNKWCFIGKETIELLAETQTVLNSVELYEDINNISVNGGTISFKYNKNLEKELEKIYSLIGANISHESEVLDNG